MHTPFLFRDIMQNSRNLDKRSGHDAPRPVENLRINLKATLLYFTRPPCSIFNQYLERFQVGMFVIILFVDPNRDSQPDPANQMRDLLITRLQDLYASTMSTTIRPTDPIHTPGLPILFIYTIKPPTNPTCHSKAHIGNNQFHVSHRKTTLHATNKGANIRTFLFLCILLQPVELLFCSSTQDRSSPHQGQSSECQNHSSSRHHPIRVYPIKSRHKDLPNLIIHHPSFPHGWSEPFVQVLGAVGDSTGQAEREWAA